ncbi:MAG: hypothetical protein SFV21_16850 [Rhodospirillaceae bacterium]|nr:hypothetical protein [Rhodospirillaceae bacterium]
MSKSPVYSAIIATVLFGSTLGVLVAVGMFGVIRIGQSMIEALGMLPPRWGENNVTLMMEMAGALAVPVMVWFVVWFYRKAVKAERDLLDYRYTPPQPTSGKP